MSLELAANVLLAATKTISMIQSARKLDFVFHNPPFNKYNNDTRLNLILTVSHLLLFFLVITLM